MSYHIHLRGPGLNMLTTIKNEVLDELLRLLQEHRDDEGDLPGWPEGPRGPRPMGPPPHRPGPPPSRGHPPRRDDQRQALKAAKRALMEKSPEVVAVARKLAALPAPPLLDQPDLTFPEKLLLLGAWTEARKEKFLLHGPALVEALVQAGERPPANPKRDVMAAVRAGWITLGLFPNPNRATLTAEGWRRVGEMLS